ncbi:MAG TPA: endonuclease/exonuclease/phosphatase family protein [Polyangia bacterium]
MTRETPHFVPPVSTPVRGLKVLTVNVHQGFAFLNRRFILPQLRDAVRAVSADLVFLQEVHGAQDKHAQRFSNWPKAPQYEFLADTIWTDFAYGRNAVYPHGHHGNALLSKFPIVRQQNLDVSVGDAENRGLLHCVIQLPGKRELHAICVHLGLGESERSRQIGLLCDFVTGLPADAPVVVAGDFNDWRQRASAVLSSKAALVEVFEQTAGGAARTFPAVWPLLRLDRIYVRNLQAKTPEVLSKRPWSRLSDHVALAAEVTL